MNPRTVIRKAIVALMLVLTPLAQARTVFVCAVMNGQVLEHRCCEGGQHAVRPDDAVGTACCTASIEIGDSRSATIAAPVSDLTIKRLGDSSPDIATAAHRPQLPVVSSAAPAMLAHVDFPDARAAPLYLLTARLRL